MKFLFQTATAQLGGSGGILGKFRQFGVAAFVGFSFAVSVPTGFCQVSTNPTASSFTSPTAPAGAATGFTITTQSNVGGATTTSSGTIRSSLPGTTSGGGGIGRLNPPAGFSGQSGIGRLSPPGNNPSLAVPTTFVPPPSAALNYIQLGLTNTGTGLSTANALSGSGQNISAAGQATTNATTVSGTGFTTTNVPPALVQTNPTASQGGSLNNTGAAALRSPSFSFQSQ